MTEKVVFNFFSLIFVLLSGVLSGKSLTASNLIERNRIENNLRNAITILLRFRIEKNENLKIEVDTRKLFLNHVLKRVVEFN